MAARSDWGHFYTRDDVMKKASPQEKLTLIRKQLDAFSVLEQDVTSQFSEKTFLDNLKRLDDRYNKRHFQNLDVITNLALFRQLLLRLQLDQDGNSSDDVSVLDYFVDILRLLDDLKRLNAYFTERVYTPLVEHLYPAHGMETAATSLSGHAQAVTVLSKTSKPQQKGVVENGKAAEHAKHDDRSAKFLRTVTRLFKLQQRWSRLSSDGPISAVLFEAETTKNSEETKNDQPFSLISQLVPDLVVKASKAVAITERWYSLFVGMSDTETQSREEQIEELRQKINKTSRNIKQLERELAGYQEELADLTARDARYDQLTEAFQRASVSSEELSSDVSDLEEMEKKITKQLSEYTQRQDIREYEGLKEEAGQIQEKLQSTRHNLELARYHSAILRGDMELLMDVLPSFQHFGISVNERIALTEEKLENERKRQQLLQSKLHILNLKSKEIQKEKARKMEPNPQANMQSLDQNSKHAKEELKNATKRKEKGDAYLLATILVSFDFEG